MVVYAMSLPIPEQQEDSRPPQLVIESESRLVAIGTDEGFPVRRLEVLGIFVLRCFFAAFAA